MVNPTSEMTQMLERWQAGDGAAREYLVEQVYSELKRIARSQFRMERNNLTLQPTALVHEAYLKLAQAEHLSFTNRAHFIAITANVMRQILVDSARRRQAQKRRAPDPITLSFDAQGLEQNRVDLMALEAALTRLGTLAPRQAQIVELRFFGGLTAAEAAAVLDISEPTVRREWRAARTWLFVQMESTGTE